MTQWKRRILIVDDDALLASLLCSVLEGAGFATLACNSTAQARREIDPFDPDLVILDVNLGEGTTGAQFGYVLQQTHPGTPLMFLTRYPTALAAERVGGRMLDSVPVVSKDDIHDSSALVDAVESAMRGQVRVTRGKVPSDPGIKELTRTQLEVLSYVAEGLTNEAIARRRGVSERAVEKQVKMIYESLHLHGDRDHNARVVAARRYARAMGDAGVHRH